MSGTVNLSALVDVGQQTNIILTQILAALRGGIALLDIVNSYTVAGLPLAGAAGQLAWAADGRKPGEGAGLGTGVFVFWNPDTSQWFSFASTALVTV